MNNENRIRAAAIVGLIAVSFLLSACNTVAGAGKDTQAAGRAVTEEANEHK